jgi:preprotein translocase subunit SecG
MLLNILLAILVLVCFALTGVILLQRSEGGALGMGGGPSGMFTARGAGDLLTRATSILAAAFFILSLAITLLAGHNRATSSITQRLKVGSEDLSSVAKPQSSAPASGAPAAPPLPTGAPPLPTTAAPAPSMPTQAPRPTLRTTRSGNMVGAPGTGLPVIGGQQPQAQRPASPSQSAPASK